MSDYFESIMRGMNEALEIAQGKRAPAATHLIEVPAPDVAAIRARSGLSQAAFARSIGVKKATLLNWEQKRRKPDGPARVLLALIDKDPGLVQRMLG